MSKKIGVFIVTAILVCAISMPIFADEINTYVPASSARKVFQTTLNGVQVNVIVTSFQPTFDSAVRDAYGSSIVTNQYFVQFQIKNYTENTMVWPNNYFRFGFKTYVAESDVYGFRIVDIGGDLVSLNQYGYYFDVDVSSDFRSYDRSTIVLKPHTIIDGYFIFEMSEVANIFAYSTSTENFQESIQEIIWPQDTLTFSVDNTATTYSEYYNIYEINENVKQILEAYTNTSEAASNVTDQADDINSSLSSIHDQEQTWYTQNQEAIESTGISNFGYSTSQASGLSGVRYLFSQLWTSLGDFTFIYTFTLMISFTTFVLRHRPATRSTTKKSKSEGG